MRRRRTRERMKLMRLTEAQCSFSQSVLSCQFAVTHRQNHLRFLFANPCVRMFLILFLSEAETAGGNRSHGLHQCVSKDGESNSVESGQTAGTHNVGANTWYVGKRGILGRWEGVCGMDPLLPSLPFCLAMQTALMKTTAPDGEMKTASPR